MHVGKGIGIYANQGATENKVQLHSERFSGMYTVQERAEDRSLYKTD